MFQREILMIQQARFEFANEITTLKSRCRKSFRKFSAEKPSAQHPQKPFVIPGKDD